MMKKCTKCNIYKEEVTDFSFRRDSKKYRNDCKICRKAYYTQYNLLNKDKLSSYGKNYRLKNIDYLKKYDKTRSDYAERKEKRNLRSKHRRIADPSFKLICYRRTRRYAILNNTKKASVLQDLNCTVHEWKEYLEQRFDENMTWDNYGKYWHLDEIIPCTAWDLSNLIEQKACFHYMNSQPLEKHANIAKGGANRKDYTKEKIQFLMVLKALGEI